MKRHLTPAAALMTVLVLVLFAPAAAFSQLSEGFENGIPNTWTFSGQTALDGTAQASSGVTPTQGSYFGWISTGCTTAAGTSCPAVATQSTPSYSQLGLGPGTGLGTPTTETVLTSPNFTLASPGGAISFDVNFITTDGTTAFADFALVQLVPSAGNPIDLFVANTTTANAAAVPPVDLNPGVAAISPATASFAGTTVTLAIDEITADNTVYGNVAKFGGGNGGPTGWMHVSYAAPAGTYTLQFTVSHAGDTAYPSALAIDNVAVAQSQIGQSINPNNAANLSQQFVFNNTTGEHVEFDFDYTTAFNTNNDLMVVNNTVPTIADQGITHATYKQLVMGTSLAMTDCFTANGQGTDANGDPFCAQMTITCTNANSNTPAGDNCPQSTQRNLYLAQQLDTPGNGMSIPSSSAPTLAEGSDTWSPNNCTFTPGSPEGGKLCPQSTLTQFELLTTDNGPKPGGTGTTTNSTFIAGCCQVEWNTVPSIPAWSNSTTVPVSFTAYPPTPATPSNNWVAAPNQAITWGEENLGATPDTTFPVPGDQTATNPTACPSTWPTPSTVPPTFTASGSVTAPGPGVFEVHFFSDACDNQEELAFPGTISTGSPNNVASFKTASFGVDQTAPTISAPVLSGGLGNNTFGLGTNPTASFTCTDPLVNGAASGIAGCGNKVTPSPGNAFTQTTTPRVAPAPSGPLTQTVTGFAVPTSTSGPQTLTVYATDEAGNQSSASAPYCVGYKIVSTDNAGNIGFTAPVLNPGPNPAVPNINSASVHQAIPLQVTVTDCNGNPVTNLALAPTGTVVLSAANANICKVDTPDNSVSTAAAGNSGWQNLGGGAYQYNWKPLPPKGACLSFSLNLGDGIPYTAYFTFK